jgi:hypothetical protein
MQTSEISPRHRHQRTAPPSPVEVDIPAKVAVMDRESATTVGKDLRYSFARDR